MGKKIPSRFTDDIGFKKIKPSEITNPEYSAGYKEARAEKSFTKEELRKFSMVWRCGYADGLREMLAEIKAMDKK